jgi:hypothetical protein
MRRRDFITMLGATAILPIAAHAQERVRRVGVLMALAAESPDAQANLAAFLQELRQLGWTDGRNLRIDIRWGAGNADNIRKGATELAMFGPGRHLRRRRLVRGAVASGDSHRADRVRDGPRSGRLRLCRQLGRPAATRPLYAV